MRDGDGFILSLANAGQAKQPRCPVIGSSLLDLDTIAAGLQLNKSGLWKGKSKTEVSYPESGHSRLAELEERSFWFRHRNNCILKVINRIMKKM